MSCLHPVKVVRNGEVNYFPCGKCMSCRNSKSHLHEQLCRVESSLHKYTVFATLTYAPEHLPVVEVEYHEENGFFNVGVVSRTDRVTEFFETDVIHETRVPLHEISKYVLPVLRNKFRLEEQNTFGILFYRDVQLFNKRLRKHIDISWLQRYKVKHNIKKLSYEEKKNVLRSVPRYRFYTVGEYGPRTYRPHYHILFYTDSRWLSTAIRRFVHTSWQLGRTDCQLSNGEANSYTAGYATSVCNLPPLIADVPQRFCVHSQNFGHTPFEELGSHISEVRYKDLAGRNLVYSGRLHELRCPSSYEACLFPKTFGLCNSAHFTNLRRYQSFGALSGIFGTKTVSEIVELYLGHFDLITTLRNPDYSLYKLGLALYTPDVLLGSDYDECDEQVLRSRLTSILYTSKHFSKMCVKFGLSSDYYYRVICNYYTDKEMYFFLKQFHEMENEIASNPPTLIYYYSNISRTYWRYQPREILDRLYRFFSVPNPDYLNKLLYYLEHYEKLPQVEFARDTASRMVISKTKHKDVNDLNQIFNYKELY